MKTSFSFTFLVCLANYPRIELCSIWWRIVKLVPIVCRLLVKLVTWKWLVVSVAQEIVKWRVRAGTKCRFIYIFRLMPNCLYMEYDPKEERKDRALGCVKAARVDGTENEWLSQGAHEGAIFTVKSKWLTYNFFIRNYIFSVYCWFICNKNYVW